MTEETILTTPSAFATAVAEAASHHNPPPLLAPAPVIDYTALAAAMAGTTINSGGSTNTNNRNGRGRRRTSDLSGHGYCWSHGYMKNPSHTSSTCRNKHAGHVDAATADNKMGGKSHVWQPPQVNNL